MYEPFYFMQALDFVVSEARKYGMKLIMTFTNNYPVYGGRHQYVEWAKAAGVAVNGDDDFYTNPVIKGYYKNYVKVIYDFFLYLSQYIFVFEKN